MVLGLVAVAGVLSGQGLARRVDDSPETVRIERKGEELDVGVSPGTLAALHAWRDAERSRSLRGARLADDTVLVLARGQDAQARCRGAEQLSIAAVRAEGSPPAVAADPAAPPMVDAPPGAVATFTATHYFCGQWNYGNAYYCGVMASGEQVYAGAVACDPLRMGQEVEVQGVRGRCMDTGGMVGALSLDWWCYSIERWDWPGSGNDAPCPTFVDEAPELPGVQVTARWLDR